MSGYDRASGLGSVDAALLISHWADLAKKATPSLSLTASSPALTLIPGQNTQITVTSRPGGTFNSAVTVAVAGATAGLTATLKSNTIAAPGCGSVVLVLSASVAARPGIYALTVTGRGGSQSATATISVMVPAPTFALTASAAAISASPGSSTQISFTVRPQNGFAAPIALSAAGLPAGVAATFSPATLSGATAGTTILRLALAATVKAGSYSLLIAGTGGGQTASVPLTLTVAGVANFSFAVSTASITIQQGGAAGTVVVSTGNFTGGFNSTITITFGGLGPGMNYGSRGATAGNNLVNVSEGITASSATAPGLYPVTITASGAGVIHSAIVQVTVAKPATSAHH